jgi:hypothetical protein
VSKPIPIRSVGGKVRIVDHAGETLEWVSQEQAQRMIQEGRVEILGTRKKIRAIRPFTPDPDIKLRKFRKAGFGTAHQLETYDNPKGVWTLDRILPSKRKLFTTVVDECIKSSPKAA